MTPSTDTDHDRFVSQLTHLQWKFLAIFEVFEEPISLDIAGELVPLPPAQMFDLLRRGEELGWVHRADNGWFSLSRTAPDEVRARLREINTKARLNALLNQLQASESASRLDAGLRARLLEKAGKGGESLRMELERHREQIRRLSQSTRQSEINTLIRRLLAFPAGNEFAIDFIDAVIDLSNRVLSTDRLIALIQKALKTADKIDDQRRWALISLKLGLAYYSEFRPGEAFAAISAGKAKVEALGDKDLTDQAIGYIGFYYHINGRHLQAVTYLQAAANRGASGDNIFSFAWTPIFLSLSEAYIGRYHSAIGRLDYLCRYFRIPGNDRLEAALRLFARYFLAMTLFFLGQTGRAESIFQEIRREMIDSALLNFYVLKSLGYIYMKTGRVMEGLRLWNSSFRNGSPGNHQGQYLSALIFEVITGVERSGHAAPEGWCFEDQYPNIRNGPNLHLRGVAYRLKALQILETERDVAAALAFLQDSEQDLLETGDRIQLMRTRLEIMKLEAGRGNTARARELETEIGSMLSAIDTRFLPDDLTRGLQGIASRIGETDRDDAAVDSYFEMLGKLSPCSTVSEAFGFILLAVSDYFGTERAGFFKLDPNIDKLTELLYSLNLSADEVVTPDFYPMLQNIRECKRTRRPVVFAAQQGNPSDNSRNPRSCFCIPLDIEELMSGVLYFDNLYLEPTIREAARNILDRLGPYLARYLKQVNQLAAEMRSSHDDELKKSAEIRRYRNADMVFRSPELSGLVAKAGRIAASEATILIHGETGVGKEMMARWIHENSPFREKPFVVVDFSTMPESLIESEIFGHEKGSFTGAERQKIGRIELANNGTLFVDEVGEIPLPLQVKLLRVLQEKQFYRVGGIKPIDSAFRLLVATNRDLAREVTAGRFRQDLYYRLNVLSIKIPPLRERKQDITALAGHFFDYYRKKHNRPSLVLLPEHEAVLLRNDWPGNVRELKNAIERSVLVSEDGRLEIDLQTQSTEPAEHPYHNDPTLDELQARYIQHIINKTGGRIGGKRGAAAILGIKRTSLYARMKKLGIDPKTR